MRSVAVIGSGSWATAIVKILLNNVEEVHWWVREPEIKQSLETNGVNALYLSGLEFPKERLRVSHDLAAVVSAVEAVVLVVPSAFVEDTLQALPDSAWAGKKVCSATKGIIPQTNQVVGEYLRDRWHIAERDMAVISGPSHAEEVALGRLTYLTAASVDEATAKYFADLFACRYVHVRLSDDVYGIEYAAVIKNVYALAVGIAKGLGYGDNFVAVLVANAVEEMNVFLREVHHIHRNLASAPYIGDLLVTSYSQFSRNRTFGNMIGQGYSVRSAILEMKMVAEGYYASRCVHDIKRAMPIAMPILEAVHDILYENKKAATVFAALEPKLR